MYKSYGTIEWKNGSILLIIKDNIPWLKENLSAQLVKTRAILRPLKEVPIIVEDTVNKLTMINAKGNHSRFFPDDSYVSTVEPTNWTKIESKKKKEDAVSYPFFFVGM
jgi:hypothetical protein